MWTLADTHDGFDALDCSEERKKQWRMDEDERRNVSRLLPNVAFLQLGQTVCGFAKVHS